MSEGAETLRVMTYNLHGCVGTDRRYDPTRTLEVIRQVDPAVLGMQEVRKGTGQSLEILDMIREMHPEYTVLFIRTLVDGRGEYGNALVSRYPLLDHIDIDLEEPLNPHAGGKQPEARRAIFGRLDTGGRPLWVVVTHLALEGGVRKRQAKILIDALRRHIDLESDGAIFMGDFNEWRWPNAFLRYLDRTFSKHAVRRTFPSRFPLLPLDRIWMTAGLTRHDIRAHRTALARRASDHLPLYLDCSF